MCVMSPEDVSPPDASVVPLSPTGVFLCMEPCGVNGHCRNGVLAARRDTDNAVVYEIECPDGFRETPGLAHTSWTAGVMSEICGQSPLWLGIIAFTGTVTTRYQAPVPIGERLIGRVSFEGHEGRKIFVNATLTSSATGVELATAKTIMIAAEARNIEERFGDITPP
jgi:hypothetical protein